MFKVQNLCKKFGFFAVFENLNFELQKGDFVALSGKNGQGKTTLLKTLAHLYPASQGAIFWNNKKITDELNCYRKIFFLLSGENSLYHSFSALENLQFFCSFYQKVTTRQILESLAEVELHKIAKIPIQNFSTGMKKKLLLVLMKLQNPQLLFLDEPYAGLDQRGKNYLDGLLENFHQQGAIILLVTHNNQPLLANHFWELNQKKIKIKTLV